MLLVNHHPARLSRNSVCGGTYKLCSAKKLNINPQDKNKKVFIMGVTRNCKMETQQEQYTYLLIMRQQR
jgi:hypothetical protein